MISIQFATYCHVSPLISFLRELSGVNLKLPNDTDFLTIRFRNSNSLKTTKLISLKSPNIPLMALKV